MKPLGNIDIKRKYVIYEKQHISGATVYNIYRRYWIFLGVLVHTTNTKAHAIQWARFNEVSGKPKKIYETGKGEIA